jgi:diguanylate cyclase (GGDEF)-like protein
MLSQKRQIGVWGIGILLYPIFLYIAYKTTPDSTIIFTFDYLLFLFLGITVALFPVTVAGQTIFLINSVSIATFLIYGLLPEMILTAVATLTLMIKIQIAADEHYRIPFNLMMFQLLSMVGASAYFLIEPHVSLVNFYEYNLLSLFVYLYVYLIMNQVILYISDVYLLKRLRTKIFKKSFRFSLFSTFYTIPASVILVYLYETFMIAGILIMGVPLVALSISFKLYYKSKETNDYLYQVNILARKLTGLHSRLDVVDTYMTSLSAIIPSDALILYEVTAQYELKRIRYFDEKSGLEMHNATFSIQEIKGTILEEAWDKGETIVYNRSEKWSAPIKRELSYASQSVIVSPVKRGQRTTGLFMLVHHKRSLYNETLLSAFNALHSYFNIALDNSKQYEELQLTSETDHLTGLPNLRAFEQTIHDYDVLYPQEIRSLVVVDLDHFKRINDTYGHEAGNDVLRHFSDILRTFVGNQGDIARYGGEEFIIFLPNFSTEKAYQFAEDLRHSLEETIFYSKNYLKNIKQEIALKVTASIGVATYPEGESSSDELISKADRAMYLGSKRNGRNKVTTYSKEWEESL